MTQDKSGFPEILDKNVSVLVRTPTPGGGDSSSVDFTIHDNFTFFVPKNVSNNSGDSIESSLVVDSTGNINVVWEDDTPGNFGTYFSRSLDDGSTWTAVLLYLILPEVPTLPQLEWTVPAISISYGKIILPAIVRYILPAAPADRRKYEKKL
jgi:hypothetical protein